MDNWDEIRTAFHVARLGTVSGAADALKVHHATVIRHIDALEQQLGVKLFQRHARGYTPTEAGADLLKVAQTAEDQFSQLEGRIKGQGEAVTGELIVTSLESLSSMIVPVLSEFQTMHPDLRVQYLTGDRLFKLEYGEAHVAIRAGDMPDQPDNVVQLLGKLEVALYASRDYLNRNGTPKSAADLQNHRFVVRDAHRGRAPYYRWLEEHVPDTTVAFGSASTEALGIAVSNGVGLGFMGIGTAANYPNLVQVMGPRPDWAAPLWIVTHVDLHRSLKVQSFVKHLKAEAKAWFD